MNVSIKTHIPGQKSRRVLASVKRLNGGWGGAYPFVHSREGSGCYFKDLDGNVFLDFASQVASNPLGYNHPDIRRVIKMCALHSPVKYAGQDFVVKEHAMLLEELLSVTPKKLDAAFLINSGAEAVENAIKICMHKRPNAAFGVSCAGDFHGRTLGALSYTHSKPVQKKGFFEVPNKVVPFGEEAPVHLERIIKKNGAEKVAFVLMECVQGEGGYNVAPKSMVKGMREVASTYHIPLICDEVQSGMGRTGKWWAFQHYGISPDVITSAKALNVGATIAHKKMFPDEPGAISSTWGGGHVVDLAVGVQTIKTIKKRKLLGKVARDGVYIRKRLQEISAKKCPEIEGVRGLGLMCAFDLPAKKLRDDVVLGALQHGLVVLGCGQRGIRLIPPFIVARKEIEEALYILMSVIRKCGVRGFRHRGVICQFADCTESTT